MGAKTIISNVLTLWGGDCTQAKRQDLVIQDDRIADVAVPGRAEAVDARLIDGSKLLAVPGLINGHFHSGEHFHKGRLENLPVELLICHVRPPAPISLTPRQIYLRTMVGAIEAIRSGTTTVVDDLNQDLPEESMEALFSAYEDSGLRALVSSQMVDIPFHRSVPGYDSLPSELRSRWDATPAPEPEHLLAKARLLASKRHPSRCRVGYVLAPSAPQRCTGKLLMAVRRMADELDLPVIIHVHETLAQVHHGRHLFGRSMVEHLAEIGFLRPATSLIHAVWLTSDDISAIAASGASIQHNPWCNLCLGSGVAPIREVIDAGINVSLGSDGAGATGTLNMLTVLGAGATAGKLRGNHPERWITAAEMLRAATEGGARALGMAGRIGALRPGLQADLALFRVDAAPFVPLSDAARQLVLAERGSNLDTVLVAGRTIMEGGRLTTVDEGRILSEAMEEFEKLRHQFEHATNAAAAIGQEFERIRQEWLRPGCHPSLHPARLHEGPAEYPLPDRH